MVEIKEIIPSRRKGFAGIILYRMLLFPVVFIGWNFFAPLFLVFLYAFVADIFSEHSFRQKTILSLLYAIIFNVGILSWLFSVESGYVALLYNIILHFLLYLSIFMICRKGSNLISGLAIYLLFEFLSNITNFLFPWTNLGNVLCQFPLAIQWYAITGPLGGSLWLLAITYCILNFVRQRNKNAVQKLAFVFLVPIMLSFTLYFSNTPQHTATRDFITFNPAYSANKSSLITSADNENICYYVSNALRKEQGNYVLLIPEITLRGVYFPRFNNSLCATYLRQLIAKDKCTEVFLGASCYTDYDVFNSAIVMDSASSYIKYKNRLIPYAETLPRFLNRYFHKPSYTTGAKDSASVINKVFKFSPNICYDAFFPFYYSKSIKDVDVGIVISSEDFLNKNTIGMRQYSNLLKLRCIETGKPLIKNSAHGVSMVINKFGQVEFTGKNTEWNRTVLKYDKKPKNTIFTDIVSHLNL
ncbi:hypothetical protein HYN48_09190 [Flavobacterium magnum]|uniref:CN hydrolase domain-containing protein n=1 Tax=Flavobacterium magnum TaxID=2162713 RepID=A0A2S0RGL1_9FLAO|nr:nitrilase-related carbon-nitrogen hydrolase [Flavobacterium magnum]AWA30241.1 hypothetical protein HYN48_09190 [Flavobacterium magnum]